MITALELNSIAQVSAARIVDSLVEGTLIAIFAGALLRVVRGLTSASRFAVCFSAMMAIASRALLGVAGRSHVTVDSTVSSHPVLVVPGTWALYIFGVWIVIAGLLLARVGIGVADLYRLRRSCVPADPFLVEGGVCEGLEFRGKSRSVSLCISDLVNVPTAIGFVHPAVVLPSWLIQDLSPADLRQLVLHELAHLRRWDDWTNLAQQIVKALLFFHPAVWWIEKQVSLEREMACDDAVVAQTANPRAYAECLAHLAEKSVIRRGLALAQAAVGRIRQTSLRVARILRGGRPATTTQGWVAATVFAAFALACGIVARWTPPLITFEQAPVPVLAARLTPPPQMNVSAREAVDAKSPVSRPVAAKGAGSKDRSQVEARLAPSRARQGTRKPASLPELVPAQWGQIASKSAPVTHTVYVIIESRDYLPSGVIVWRSGIWRITLVPPSDLNRKIFRTQT